MSLGIRLADSLKGAGLSPRILGAITQVHYTTIYKLISQKEDAKTYPVMEKELTSALDRIDKLIASGVLPFRDKISDKEKTDRLAFILADND